MRGKFSERLGLWRWRDQTGGRLGNPQHHGVAVGDEDIAHTVRARASRDQRKTTPEEWMPRVCDFHFSQVVYQGGLWVGFGVCGVLGPLCQGALLGFLTEINRPANNSLDLIKGWLKGRLRQGSTIHAPQGRLKGGFVTPPTKLQTFFFGVGLSRYGSTRKTTLTCSWVTSTRLTKARIISRLLSQSAVL